MGPGAVKYIAVVLREDEEEDKSFNHIPGPFAPSSHRPIRISFQLKISFRNVLPRPEASSMGDRRLAPFPFPLQPSPRHHYQLFDEFRGSMAGGGAAIVSHKVRKFG